MSKIVVTKIDEGAKRDLPGEERARNFLLGLNSDGGWHNVNAINVGHSGNSTVVGGGCHGGLSSLSTPLALASEVAATPADHERFNRWWAWMTDREKSPWKALMQHGIELVLHKNGNPAGFILPRQTLEEVPFRFQKNFCIQARTFQESYARWVLWDYLIEEYKMDRTDAYYFISVMGPHSKDYVTRSPFKPEYLIISSLRTGGHWALTDVEQPDGWEAKINWNVLRTGDIDKGVNTQGKSVYNTQINAFFMWPKPDYKEYKIWRPNQAELISTNQKGRFSQIQAITIPAAIDSFYKWQDEQGILK